MGGEQSGFDHCDKRKKQQPCMPEVRDDACHSSDTEAQGYLQTESFYTH